MVYNKIDEYRHNPQEVADAVLNLINMKNGTRPFQTVVNRAGEGIEQEFADSKLPVKIKWLEKMGWGAY